MSQENTKPVKQFRAKGNIVASIWKNEVVQDGRTQERYSVQIRKQYKKENGEYQETNRFFPDELPRLVLVAQKAYAHITIRDEIDDLVATSM